MATAVKRDPSKLERPGTFRILEGDHIGDGPPGCECNDCLTSSGKNHRYRARLLDNKGKPMHHTPGVKFANDDEREAYARKYDNDVIESTVDLVIRCNSYNSIKFERIDNNQSHHSSQHHQQQFAEPRSFPVERMTTAQLLAVAEDEDIPLRGIGASKEEILAAIQLAREERTG